MTSTVVRSSTLVGVIGLAVVCLPGCAVMVQNQYSVFGFDRFRTDSPEQARTWSLALLGVVALVSAIAGAITFWFGQRVYRRWGSRREQTESIDTSNPEPVQIGSSE